MKKEVILKMNDYERQGVAGYKKRWRTQEVNLKEILLSKQKFHLNRCASVGSKKFGIYI